MMLKFAKMHGLGNDFMVVDGISQNVYLSPDKIRQLADRHTGVGFDQLLLVEPPYDPELDFHYRIFNADGTEAGQCGNGARCFARFVRNKGLTHKQHIAVSTRSGKLMLHLERDGQVTVDMGEPLFEPEQIPFVAKKREGTYILRLADQTIFCTVLSMGNPHCVIKVDDLATTDVASLGAAIAAHERFPESVNVGFMQVINPRKILLRVYERGAGETLACGSGACAAMVAGRLYHGLASQVSVVLPSGELQIRWPGEGKVVKMTGPAVHVFDGKIAL